MKSKKLKLYVWEDVLHNYTSGIMFAFAENIDHAIELISVKMNDCHDDLKIRPREITEPEGFYVYGSF